MRPIHHQEVAAAPEAEFSQRARAVRVSLQRQIEFRLPQQSARSSVSVACLIQAEGKLTDFG